MEKVLRVISNYVVNYKKLQIFTVWMYAFVITRRFLNVGYYIGIIYFVISHGMITRMHTQSNIEATRKSGPFENIVQSQSHWLTSSDLTLISRDVLQNLRAEGRSKSTRLQTRLLFSRVPARQLLTSCELIIL